METQKGKIKIAVVILNWNGKEWLQKFLPTLVGNSNDSTVFLADNGSDDDSLFFIKKEFPSIRIIENNENLGFAGGYNKALTHIHAKYYVLVNSDLEVTPAWLSPIISLMDEDKNIAACQPKILDYNNRERFEYAGASGGYIDNLGYPFCRGRIFNHLEEDKGQYNDLKEVFWATGACLFLRSDAFWGVGGFDASFFAHQEEVDLCWRMKNNGFKIMVEPKSIVYHVGGGTLNSGSTFKTYLNFRNNLSMLFKNLPLYYLVFIIPVRLVLDGVAALTFLTKEKGIGHLFAVIKAHFSFYFAVPKLITKRQKITQQNKLAGKMGKSLLVRNKLKGINVFSDL